MKRGPEWWQLSDCQPDGTECALYRFFDRTGRLLYLGISKRPYDRFSAHRRAAAWWADAYCYTTEIHPTYEHALLAELPAIRRERPIWNLRGAA